MEQIELPKERVEKAAFVDKEKQLMYNLINETKTLLQQNAALEREVKVLRDGSRKSLAELENSYLEREAELKLELESGREALRSREEYHLKRLRDIQDEIDSVKRTGAQIVNELKTENSDLKNRLIEQKRVLYEKQHRMREVLLKIKNHFNELSELGNIFDDLKVGFNDAELAYLIRHDLTKGMDYREIIDYYQRFGYDSEYIMGIINKNSGFLG